MDARCQRLPPELVHNVLEDLDKPSLATCTLVSRDFMELARPCLFRNIIWNFCRSPGPQSDASGAPARLQQHHLPERFPLLADFLESQPKIASYVRRVKLCMIGDERFYSFVVFLRILRRLPRLHALTLVGIPDEGPGYIFPDPRETVSVPLLPSLHTLKFTDTFMRQPNDINYILCLFGSIEHLIFTDYYGYDKEDDSVSDLPYPRLGLLELNDHFAIADLIPWMQPQQIHKLKIPLPPSPPGLYVVQEAITKLGGALHHVHFTFAPRGTFYARQNAQAHAMEQDFFDLSSTTSLESIVLPLLICRTASGEPQVAATTLIHQDTYNTIIATLATAARSLRKITVELYVAFLADSWERSSRAGREELVVIREEASLRELRHLGELEEVCLRMALRTLEVRAAPGSRLSEREKEGFREGLPRPLERGVLRFS
ncbi:F-box protein [Phanerochaete sordida]|uniref:F-box protein n=1 Tax=Phanerochaete sordida TaxID=48140 RepID=A0A9P3G1U7_9APHY|nr:F-box protein [Phanerochaete sordida]